MVRKIKIIIAMPVLLSAALILSVVGTSAETTTAGIPTHTGSESESTRIIYGTVDDVARNLVKVNQENTEGITPRYLDLKEVGKESSIKKGDQVKMKVNQHNIVIDYWIVEEK